MLAANFSFYGETKFFFFSVYSMLAKSILFVAFIFTTFVITYKTLAIQTLLLSLFFDLFNNIK